jgi:hypothetical protein
MQCPECQSKDIGEDWFVAFIGPRNWHIEFHVFFCNTCGWTTVQDCKRADEENDDA